MSNSVSTFFSVPEMIDMVFSWLDDPAHLLNCACVSNSWNRRAVRKLYQGSMLDLRFRTPDVTWIDGILMASRKRFAQYFVNTDHLMIASRTPELRTDDLEVCPVPCRALQRRRDAEYLFHPYGKLGPRSLVIPFPLVHNDLWNTKDIVFAKSLGFLTINLEYCIALEHLPDDSLALTGPKLPNLTALSIHVSNEEPDFLPLYSVLQSADLTIFNIQLQRLDVRPYDYGLLMDALIRQKNLRALSLCEIPEIDDDVDNDPAIPLILFKQRLWPRLKAIYLPITHEYWVERIPEWRDIRILALGEIDFALEPCVPVPNQLTVLQYVTENDDLLVDLTSLAKRCPCLRSISVVAKRRHNPTALPSLTNTERFALLLRALPRIEFLSVSLPLRMNWSHFSDIAEHCPRLTYLALSAAHLSFEFQEFSWLPALATLKYLRVRVITIGDPLRYMHGAALQSITELWHNVLPNLRVMPCPADGHAPEIFSDEECPPMNTSGRTIFGVNELYPLHCVDYPSDSFYLRRKIWSLLQYPSHVHWPERMRTRWLNKFEVKLLGWPILPLSFYLDPPNEHSCIC